MTEAENHYRRLFDNHHAVMLLIDPENGAIIDANPAAVEFYGWSHDELRARSITDINILTPDEVAAEMRAAVNQQRGYFLFRHRLNDGSIRDVEVYSGPTRVAGRTLLYSIIHDVTARRQAERELRHRSRQLSCLHSLARIIEGHSDNAHRILATAVQLLPPAWADPDRTAARIVWGNHGFAAGDMESCPLRISAPLVARQEVVGAIEIGRIEAPGEESENPFSPEEHDLLDTVAERLGRVIEHSHAADQLLTQGRLLEQTEWAAQIGHWEWDLATDVITWSPELYRILKLDPAAGPPPFDEGLQLFRPDDRIRLRAAAAAAMSRGAPYDMELTAVGADGQLRHCRTTGAVKRGPKGTPSHLCGTFQDVTENKLLEALRASEARYRLLAEHATDLISTHTAQGVYTFASPICESLLGYTADELLGRHAYELFHPDDLSRIRASHDRVLTDQEIVTIAYRIRHKDGHFIWFETNSRVVSSPDTGEVHQIIAVSRDISDRIRAQDALRRSEAQLAETNQLLSGVLEHTHMMAVYLDTGFNFLWVNRAYAATCGTTPDQLVGKNHFELFPDGENQTIFQRVVDSGEPYVAAAKPFTFPDQPERGVTFWDWSLIPITQADGRVAGLVFTLAEVTERIRAAKREHQLRREIDHRLKNTMLSVVSIAKLSFANTSDPLASCDSFVQRLMAMSQAHSLLARASWGDVALHEVVDTILAPHRGDSVARIVAGGDRVILRSDKGLILSMMLHELVTNAVKHGALSSPTGQVDIRWQRMDDQPEGEHCTVELHWRESGGPPVAPPSARNFGLTMLEESGPYELGYATELRFDPQGLQCSIRFTDATRP